MSRDYQTRGYIGGAPTTSTLAGSMGTGDTTFSFNTGGGTGFPTTNFWIVVDPLNGSAEKMLVGSRSGDACTGVVRAQDNTTAKSHSAGASILHTGAAQDFTEANAVAAALTTKGDSLWKGGTLSVAPARLAAGTDQQIIRYLAANALGVETTFLGSVPKFATTAARDAAIAAPSSGQADYEDTGDTLEGLWFYNGTSWRRAWNMPWGVMGVATTTTAQTGISTIVDLTSLTITFTAVTGRRYKYSGQVSVKQQTSAAIVDLVLTTTTPTTVIQTTAQMAAANQNTMTFTGYETISAGSVTRKLRLQTSAGTVDAQTGNIASFYIVEDIGPSGAPT